MFNILFIIDVQGAFLYYTTTLAILNTNLISKDAWVSRKILMKVVCGNHTNIQTCWSMSWTLMFYGTNLVLCVILW